MRESILVPPEFVLVEILLPYGESEIELLRAMVALLVDWVAILGTAAERGADKVLFNDGVAWPYPMVANNITTKETGLRGFIYL